MADKGFNLSLNCRGELDTAMPISDRAPGTLVAALDVSPKFIGPRRGSQAFTRPWENVGTGSLYDIITFTTGASTYGIGHGFDEQFRDLGTKWTLDIWFRLTSTAYASGKDKIGLYKWVASATGVIEVSINGPAHASPGRIHVYIVTTASRGTPDTPVEFNCSTAFSVGSAQTDIHHVRVVRDGASVTVYLNGVADGSTTSLIATAGILGAVNGQALVGLGALYIATDPTVSTKGTIFGAWLRDGAFSSAPIESRMPDDPWARNVHHAYLGHSISMNGSVHFFDAGRFGAHARLNGSDYTVTSSYFNAAPAPSPVQGLVTWTTRTNRTATSVMCGGVLYTAIIS